MNHNIALPPTLPTALRFPNLAIPTTSVVKTKGAIMVFTRRIKMVPKSFTLPEKPEIKSAGANS